MHQIVCRLEFAPDPTGDASPDPLAGLGGGPPGKGKEGGEGEKEGGEGVPECPNSELASLKTTNVCDTWPVRRQTYGYVPSHKASPPIGWYQIILLGDRSTYVLTTCPGLHSTPGRPEFEPTTCGSQVQRPNHSATEPHQ